MVAWRHAESLPIAEQALALARGIGAREAEVRALTVLGGDLAYLGRGEEGLAHFRQALQLAEEIGDRIGLERAYVNFTDALTMLGRPRESARLAQAGLEAMRRYGIDSALLVSNQIEALLAIGDWDEAERLSAAALRAHHLELPVLAAHPPRRRRDRPRRVRRRASAPRGRERHPARGPRARPLRRLPRRPRPLGAPLDGRGRGHRGGSGSGTPARGGADPRPAVRQGTARTGGAGSARTRPPGRRRAPRPARPRAEAARPSRGAPPPRPRRSHRTPTAGSPWPRPSTSAPAASARPETWSEAAATWDRLERPPLAAYCRWRQAEALVAAGASRTEASVPLREAHAVAARIGAKPLAARARAARRTRAARSRAARRGDRRDGSRTWRRSSA